MLISGFEQLSAAVEKTNKRVAATKGSTQYFQILDSDLETVWIIWFLVSLHIDSSVELNLYEN